MYRSYKSDMQKINRYGTPYILIFVYCPISSVINIFVSYMPLNVSFIYQQSVLKKKNNSNKQFKEIYVFFVYIKNELTVSFSGAKSERN